MVSVRPDWSDSTDLFGHVDLNGRFIPGTIIDFVKRAELDTNHPYVLCLDEMNLARVEYYLSDFLSVMETRDVNEQGSIVSAPLVSSNYYGPDKAQQVNMELLNFRKTFLLLERSIWMRRHFLSVKRFWIVPIQ